MQHNERISATSVTDVELAFFFLFPAALTLSLFSFSPIVLYQSTQHSIMPVISQQPPSIEVKETLGGKETPSLMSQSPLTTEDSVENINREKLANIKKMMRTYVDGALREKDQVSWV